MKLNNLSPFENLSSFYTVNLVMIWIILYFYSFFIWATLLWIDYVSSLFFSFCIPTVDWVVHFVAIRLSLLFVFMVCHWIMTLFQRVTTCSLWHGDFYYFSWNMDMYWMWTSHWNCCWSIWILSHSVPVISFISVYLYILYRVCGCNIAGDDDLSFVICPFDE